MKGDTILAQNGPGFLLGTNALFTPDAKSETTCIFTESMPACHCLVHASVTHVIFAILVLPFLDLNRVIVFS
jgi:hypothetical protein